MAYATVDDLIARFPRALTDAEAAQVPTMLEDASFLLSVKASGLRAAVDGEVELDIDGPGPVTTAAMLLTVAMVKRALLAQAAQQQANPGVESVTEAWGPFNRAVKYSTDNGNLFLYGSELDYLLGLLRGDTATAVSVRSRGL